MLVWSVDAQAQCRRQNEHTHQVEVKTMAISKLWNQDNCATPVAPSGAKEMPSLVQQCAGLKGSQPDNM